MNDRSSKLRNVALFVAFGLSLGALSACAAEAQAGAGAQAAPTAPAPAAPAPAAPAAAVPAAPVATTTAALTPAQPAPSATTAAPAPTAPGTAATPEKEMAPGKHHEHGKGEHADKDKDKDKDKDEAERKHHEHGEFADKEFVEHDKNKDGAIAKDEAGKHWDHIKVADANADGKVTREEFDQALAAGKLKGGDDHKPMHHPVEPKDTGKTKK